MTSIKGGRGTLYYHCLVGTAFKFFLSSKIDFIPPPPHKHTYTTRLSNGSVGLLRNPNIDWSDLSIELGPPLAQ